jgi:hypothetical protein
MRDPTSVARISPFTGVTSNIGVLLWCATSAICLFTAAVLRRRTSGMAPFLLSSGLFTLVLLLDDLFLFHEVVFPVYLAVPEVVLYVLYGVFMLALLVRFFRLIGQTEFELLLLALAYFGLSLLLDIVLALLHRRLPGHLLLEDGFKLLGIVFWAAYFVRASFHSISSNLVKYQPYR